MKDDAAIMAALQEAVQEVEGLGWRWVVSGCRIRNVVDARYRAMAAYYALAADRRGETMGRAFGKDRTTWIYAQKEHALLLATDRDYADRYHALLKCVMDKITINTFNTNDSMFTTTVSGNIGRAAEERTINGKDYYKFSVAVSDRRKDATTWVSVFYYKGNGKVGEYLQPGASVLVQGRQDTRAYTGKDGEPHAEITIWADTLEVTKYAEKAERAAQEEPVDDLPGGGEGDDLEF